MLWTVVIEIEDPGMVDPLRGPNAIYLTELDVKEMLYCVKPPFDSVKVKIKSVTRMTEVTHG